MKDDIVVKCICSGKLATHLAFLAAACRVMHLPPSIQHILVAPYIHHHDHSENSFVFFTCDVYFGLDHLVATNEVVLVCIHNSVGQIVFIFNPTSKIVS